MFKFVLILNANINNCDENSEKSQSDNINRNIYYIDFENNYINSLNPPIYYNNLNLENNNLNIQNVLDPRVHQQENNNNILINGKHCHKQNNHQESQIKNDFNSIQIKTISFAYDETLKNHDTPKLKPSNKRIIIAILKTLTGSILLSIVVLTLLFFVLFCLTFDIVYLFLLLGLVFVILSINVLIDKNLL